MKKISVCLAAAVLALGMFAAAIGGEDLKPLVIDVRTQAEWDGGHIEGAILIPYEQIGKRIGEVTRDKKRRIYVYCRTGRRAQIAIKTLEKLGYRDLVNLGSLEEAARALKRRIVRDGT